MPNVIKEARLACVDLKTGKQKLYWMDLQDDGKVRVRYGRIREERGELVFQHDDINTGGEQYFNKQYKDKTRAGRGSGTYKEQEVVRGMETTSGTVTPATSLEQIALEQIETNSDAVKTLIKYLAQSNVHNIVSNTKIQYNSTTGLFTTAFGLITKNGINTARQNLSTIKTAMEANKLGEDYEKAIDSYLSIIPKNLPRQKASYSMVFPTVDEILKQNDILDALESSLVEYSKPVKNEETDKEEIERLFNVSLELVTDPAEQSAVEKHYLSTSRDMHSAAYGWKVANIYKLDLRSMSKAYEQAGKSKGEHQRLWHGTSAANILSILRSGFVVTPPATAHIAGKAFGNGIYFAIHSTKSMGYATSFWGGRGGEKAFLFLNDVALGKWYVPKSSVSDPPPKGYDTYWAKPTETRKFGGYLENDEIIVFDTSQINPVYLVEFSK